MAAPYGIHVESQVIDGGGVFSMDTEWIVSNSASRQEWRLSADSQEG
jgi:hypothetical protein